jgi:hypothetical protein
VAARISSSLTSDLGDVQWNSGSMISVNLEDDMVLDVNGNCVLNVERA